MKSFSPQTPSTYIFGALSGVNSPEGSECISSFDCQIECSYSSTCSTSRKKTFSSELVVRLPCLSSILETGKTDDGKDVSDIVLDEYRAPRVHLFGEAAYRYIDSPETRAVTREDLDALMAHCCSTQCRNRFSSNDDVPLRVSLFPTAGGTNLTIRLSRDTIIHDMPRKLVDDIDAGKNVLIFGSPGTGKTTCLRTILKHLDKASKNIVAIDQSDELRSNSLAGTRYYFPPPHTSLADAIHEAIRNHTPSCIVLDEIVTKQDAQAVLHANDRGVQVIATTHAASEGQVVSSPLLTTLNGGRREAALSDGEAKKNGGKFLVERRSDPTFHTLYDVRKKKVSSTAHVVDKALEQK